MTDPVSPTPTPRRPLEVPIGLRVPRLERLLGCKVQDLTTQKVEDLVARRVAEDLTLDFKQTSYERAEKGIFELTKDVCAMANASGGLIILGIAESDGSADLVTPVLLNERERQRMIDVLTQRVAPLIPDLVVEELSLSESPTEGFYIIAVPASELAPHGITRHDGQKDGYAWPVREDRFCRWMREPEIANRYRNRFAGADRQTARLDDVVKEGSWSLDRKLKGFLVLGNSPARAGAMVTSGDAVGQSREWIRTVSRDVPASVQGTTVVPGRRRIVHSTNSHYRGRSDDFHLELHGDGAGFAAVSIFEPQMHSQGPNMPPTPLQPLKADDVERWSLALLRVLAEHAVNAGAAGDLETIAALLPPWEEGVNTTFKFPGGQTYVHHMPLVVTEPYFAVGVSGVFGHRVVPGSLELQAPTPVRNTVPLTVATNFADLVAASSLIAGDLLTEFGVNYPRILRPDGRISAMQENGQAANRLVEWGRYHDVEIVA